MTKTRNNKRGDRGSLEESPRDVKKLNSQSSPSQKIEGNMAEGETATCDASFQEEPTLLQLRDILVNLESSVAAILQDNANLREELSQFRATFQSHGRDIEQLKTKLAKVISENQTLRTELHQTRKNLKEEQDDTSRMWVELDELEQYSRKSSREIYGIQELAYVSTDEAEYSAKIREFHPMFCEKLSYVKDKRLFWEMLNMEIRNVTISFAKGKASLVRKHEREIKERLDKLDKKICHSADLNNVDQELNEYDELKNELKLIYEVKSKATIFRAKCNWVENREKATKYFFNVEKRNYNRKVINEIETEEGASIKDNKEILAKI
ncbi:probable DNA double-strand break repair Rad50 ATPase [Montipora capricornis]|uniref:probable DNA double-strand break repair Rad50 ATPase n=1 Tax=Montipora capricornis TaxID=246305 RepID=UPI0035F11453